MTREKKQYTKASKIGTLRILEKNDFNYLQTQKLTGVSRSTIKNWEKELGAEVFSGISPVEQVLKEVDAEMKINDRKVIKKYYIIRNQLLDRIKDLIPNENKLEPLVNALKSISQDIGLFNELDNKEFGSTNRSFLEIFNMQIKAMKETDLSPYEENYIDNESKEDK